MAARTRPARAEAFAIREPIPARAGSNVAVIASANGDATSFIGVLRAAAMTGSGAPAKPFFEVLQKPDYRKGVRSAQQAHPRDGHTTTSAPQGIGRRR